MLKHRLLMSSILIPATIGLFAWDHRLGPTAPILLVLVLLLSARACWELITLLRETNADPQLGFCVLCVWVLLIAGWGPRCAPESNVVNQWIGSMTVSQLASGVAAAIAATTLFKSVFRYPIAARDGTTTSKGLNVGTVAAELLVVIYIGGLLVTTCQLRWCGADGIEGYFALGALVVAAKMGDVGAYTFGRLIGGPKMTPRLSPGKTWAGGVGHLLTAGAASVAWLTWLGPQVSVKWLAWPAMQAALFGVVVGFAGLLGDLVESLIKRDVGVKDAPALLPGFGGLLDLLDSLLLGGPVALAMWHILR